MVALVLAAALWQTPGALRIGHAEVRTLTLPPIAGPARLALRARADAPRSEGSHHLLRLRVNGVDVGLMRDRGAMRLVNKPATFVDRRGRVLAWFAFRRWRVQYEPATTERDALVLDVSDLLRADGPNTLRLEHGPAPAGVDAALVVEGLRVERGPDDAAIGVGPPPPPDWSTPRLGRPVPPEFGVEGDPARLRLQWGGRVLEVRTTVIGGPAVLERSVTREATHVEVRDTFANEGATAVGLRVRHAVATDAAWVHLGGRPDPDVVEAYAPWNPTVFTPAGAGGLGLVAEDDVFRQQLVVEYDRDGSAIALRTDMLCLAPGDRATLVWSAYPTRSDSYWDFINTVRDDWGVNRTVPGTYMWLHTDDVLAAPPAELQDALASHAVAIASLWGGWVDPRPRGGPPRLGFGADVAGAAFADYRERIRAAVARLKAVRPGLVVLLPFDAQRESAPDTPGRYSSELLCDLDGKLERTTWRGRSSPAWGVVPMAGEPLGDALEAAATTLRGLGADGLYWDEMDGVDYERPRFTTARWDGRSCLLTPGGAVRARVGLANLLSAELKFAIADDQAILANMPPTTRRFQERSDLRMVEAQRHDAWGPFTHLSTPLAYIGARNDWATVLEQIDDGLLIAGTPPDYQYGLPARMFPFTPEYVQPGTLRGRERIVTTRSGTHGWLGRVGALRAYRYDAAGEEHEAHWPVKVRPEGTFIHVRLEPDEAAVIERAE